MTDRELINIAVAAKENSYSPYSKFRVGAAIECSDGSVYSGCNVENAAFGECICAERVAAVKAVSDGKRSFRRIAVSTDSEGYSTPCGACRQFLHEFTPEVEVLCVKNSGNYVSYRLYDLLAHGFGLK